jgi:hypothetical protein
LEEYQIFRVLVCRSRKEILLVIKDEKWKFCNVEVWKWFALSSFEAMLLF